jgi:ABC-type branched-subunit amino acid transport system permease subunit
MHKVSNIPSSLLIKTKKMVHSIPSFLSNNRTLIAVTAFLFILPLITSTGISPIRNLLNIISQIMIFGLLAMSFDLQLGRAGLLNFGQIAFFGVGAYIIAFSLNASILPPPFNLIALIPYPLTIVLAMLVSAGLGLIMGSTTSRMKGTAFAFIALAIAMFLYNFFAENPGISGGETGLSIAVPYIMKTAPFYLMFVTIAFVFLAAFLGMTILYLKKRIDVMGLLIFVPVILAFTGFLILFGTNLIGPIIVLVSFLAMIGLQLLEKNKTISNPLQFSEKELQFTKEAKSTNRLTTHLLPIGVTILALVGLIVTFGTNILQFVDAWIQQHNTFYFTIPVQYYLVLTCLVMTYVFVRRLVASPFGRMVVAVAQNQERAEALGYNSYMCKIVVVVISGAIAGLSGALYTTYIGTIGPESALGVNGSINAMLYTIIGGISTLLGPLLGAGVVVYSELNLAEIVGNLWLVALGVIYVLIVLFLPLGIVGTVQSKTLRIKEKLTQLKIGRSGFGIKDTDYWIFVLLAAIGVFLLLLGFSLL